MSKGAVEIAGADQWDNASALVASRQVTNSTAKVFDILVFNTGGDKYIQLYDVADGTTLTPGTSVPLAEIKILADDFGYLSWPHGRRCKNGIYVTTSDTSASLGAVTADCVIDTAYKKGA